MNLEMDDMSNFNLDTGKSYLIFAAMERPLMVIKVVKVLSHTLFSPFFCAFLPLSLYGNILDIWHPAVLSSGIWTALICLIGTFLLSFMSVLADSHSYIQAC